VRFIRIPRHAKLASKIIGCAAAAKRSPCIIAVAVAGHNQARSAVEAHYAIERKSLVT
jgi:hypothetical protein